MPRGLSPVRELWGKAIRCSASYCNSCHDSDDEQSSEHDPMSCHPVENLSHAHHPLSIGFEGIRDLDKTIVEGQFLPVSYRDLERETNRKRLAFQQAPFQTTAGLKMDSASGAFLARQHSPMKFLHTRWGYNPGVCSHGSEVPVVCAQRGGPVSCCQLPLHYLTMYLVLIRVNNDGLFEERDSFVISSLTAIEVSQQ